MRTQYNSKKKIKKTKSTLPIDLPCQLTREFASQLSSPVTDIINTSLQQHKYPTLWKHEWVVLAPKKKEPKCLEDLRKISCTSDFSKLYEGFLKEWILEDIKPNLDFSQYGNEAGTGTEHMLVAFIDKVLKLLDTTEGHAAVIAAMVDWRAAFDRQDPTLAIQKFLNLGLRSSLVQVLVSYLQERKMTVKYNQKTSRMHDLPGGGPQGTLIGGIEYSVQSNDNGDFLDDDMKYKYVDDMSILEFLSLSGLLVDYDVLGHVPSDVGVDHMFLPSSEYSTQSYLNNISQWTSDNLMQLNEAKSSYMIFTRMEQEFRSRLTLNDIKLDQVHEVRLLGLLITDDLKWDSNMADICKRAYARLSMITKLKYVGVGNRDLVDIYCLFVRSLLEYCSVVWHSTLTLEQSLDIERVQKTSMKIILGDQYPGYEVALEHCKLDTLKHRREKRSLNFGLKALKHPKHKLLFPLSTPDDHHLRQPEKFHVNFARTSTYKKSTVPYIQRLMNKHFTK